MSFHFIHELLDLEFVGILTVRGRFTTRFECLGVIGHSGIDEFRASKDKEIFIALFPSLNFGEIVGMFIMNDGGYGVIEDRGGAYM